METQVNAFLASLEAQPAYAESTRLAYASDLRVFLKYLMDTLRRPPQLPDLNPGQVARFLESERQSGRRYSTLVRRWVTLRRFAAYLSRQGLLAVDALAADSDLIDGIISSVSPIPAPQCLTPGQITRLCSVIEASPRPRARRDLAILMLLLETGLSVGALTALDLPEINLQAGKVHILLDDREDAWLSMGNATQSLERYLLEGRPELSHRTDEKALFIRQLEGRMSRQGIWQVLRHWGRMVTPPILLSPRLVRHTAALRMAQTGRTITEIQSLLGHSNPLSTRALLRRLAVACGERPEISSIVK